MNLIHHNLECRGASRLHGHANNDRGLYSHGLSMPIARTLHTLLCIIRAGETAENHRSNNQRNKQDGKLANALAHKQARKQPCKQAYNPASKQQGKHANKPPTQSLSVNRRSDASINRSFDKSAYIAIGCLASTTHDNTSLRPFCNSRKYMGGMRGAFR